MAILDWTLVAVPVAGLVLATVAWLKVRRHADELTGAGLAMTGFALSLLFLVVGPSWLTYVYLTEVPDGYAADSYARVAARPA